MGEIIYLNLLEVDLHVWETITKGDKLREFLLSINAGHEFPPIPVCRLSDSEYFLHHYIY